MEIGVPGISPIRLELRSPQRIGLEPGSSEAPLGADGIALRVVGRVRNITIGGAEAQRSPVPTWLEWLQARHGLGGVWGTASYVFGLLLVVFRWRIVA